MIKVCKATFDGNVFLPKESVSIKPNTECIVFLSDIKIEEDIKTDIHPLTLISEMATDLGPADLSENLDNYIYRRPSDE